MLIVDFIASICLIFMDPILVLRLQDLGVSEDNAGLGFALMAFTFTFGSGLAGPVSEKFGKRMTIAMCSIFVGLALWLAGGLHAESIHDGSSVATWIGLALNGFFVAGPIILPMPEVYESMEQKMKKTRGSVLLVGRDGKVNDSEDATEGEDAAVKPTDSNLSDKSSAIVQIFF